MKSDDITIQQLFQDRRQYMVPFYQRAYVWTLSQQWEALWEDIRAKAEARLISSSSTPHFLGAVVLDPQKKIGLIGVDTLHIIDGQQRLTTLQLILKSILLVLRKMNLTGVSEIISGSLANSNPDTMRDPDIEKYKVWPTFIDRDVYKSAMGVDRKESLIQIFPNSFTQKETLRKIGIRHPSALEAIWYFTECFEKWIHVPKESESVLRAETLATAILQDLKVVSIVLDPDDDAQVIFETLNGRGAQLHATDLIRNFIFMRADREGVDSKKLYDDMWSQFETSYWKQGQSRGRRSKPRLEWFMHSALQAEMHEEIDLGRLYFEYRRFVFNGQNILTAPDQMDFMASYAVQYINLTDGKDQKPISVFGRRVLPFEVSTIYPLALFIGASKCTDEEKTNLFNLLFSYVVRRSICGLTTKNYNNVFLSVLRELASGDVSSDVLTNVLGSLLGEASRWPKDDEFRNACISGNIYPGRLETPKIRAVLSEIEMGFRQLNRVEDQVSQIDSRLDVDHILPKSWYQYWPLKDGSTASSSEATNVEFKQIIGNPLSVKEESILNRQKMVPTLGNLTLLNLSVNRQAQHKAFDVKKDLLIANTNLRLNVPLITLDEWTEDSIRTRGEQIAEVALRVWPGLS